MSFELRIGTTSSSAKKVKKSFKWNYNLKCILKDECPIKRPVIQLRIGDKENIAMKDITKCNYAYIPNFNRYYFIVDFKSIRNVMLEIALEEDVLMSFADEIYSQRGIVQRTESTKYITKRLDDNVAYRYTDSIIAVQKLKASDEFSEDGSYVMVTAGPSAST